MRNNNASALATGLFNTLLSTIITGLSVYYLYRVFYIHTPPDLHLMINATTPIPPETYPMLLLVAFACVSMINLVWGAGIDRNNDIGKFFFWEDIGEAALFAFLVGITVLKLSTNPTYLLVWFGFAVLSALNLFLMLLLRFRSKSDGTVVLTGGTTAGGTTIGGGTATSTTGEHMTMPLVLEIIGMRLPGGDIMPVPNTLTLKPIKLIEGSSGG